MASLHFDLVSPERLARWFVHEGNTYSVVKDLREMCIFSSHNLIKDAPFSRIDLISFIWTGSSIHPIPRSGTKWTSCGARARSNLC